VKFYEKPLLTAGGFAGGFLVDRAHEDSEYYLLIRTSASFRGATSSLLSFFKA